MRSEATPILVTGGAGFLGSWLVRALAAAGHRVRVLDDFSTGSPERLTGLAVQIIQADVRNETAVREAMEGAQAVFHLAGQQPRAARSTRDLLRAQDVNVGGTINVLEAARQVQPKRVVIASSGAVYGRTKAYVLHEEVPPAPLDPEGVQHLAIESYARIYGEAYQIPTVITRLFTCYGPGQRWKGEDAPLVPLLGMAALEGRGPTIAGDARATRDLVYVENAVAALLAAGSVQGIDGGCFNVASGEAVTLQHLWRLLTRIAGFKADAPEAKFTAPTWPEPGPVRVSLARATRDLGYTPAIHLQEGLQRTLDWLHREWSLGENGWFTPTAPQKPSPLLRRPPVARPPAPPSRDRPGLRADLAAPPPLASWWGGGARPPMPPPPPSSVSRVIAAMDDAIELDGDDLEAQIEVSVDLPEETGAASDGDGAPTVSAAEEPREPEREAQREIDVAPPAESAGAGAA